MAQCQQLDLFLDTPPFRDEEINSIRIRVENVQKGIFKRYSILEKTISSVKENQEKYECRLFAIEQFLKNKFGEDIKFDGTIFS